MKRARVITIDSSLRDEELAMFLRTVMSLAHSGAEAKMENANRLLKHARDSGYSEEKIKTDERCISATNALASLRVIDNKITFSSMIEEPRHDTYAMMEVGTCHITEDDSNILAYMCDCNTKSAYTISPLNVGHFGYGFAVMLTVDPENDDDLDLGQKQADCEKEGNNLSDAFWNILRTAKAGGYRCVYFDSDVSAHDDFEVFDW